MRGYNITGVTLAIPTMLFALVLLPVLLPAPLLAAQPAAPLPEDRTPEQAQERPTADARLAVSATRCRTLRAGLDERIAAAGIGDPRHHRRPGAPWLRTDRFLQHALRSALAAGDRLAIDGILARMSALDAQALDRELQRLTPAPGIPPEQVRACRREALAALRAQLASAQTASLLLETAGAPVEDQYSESARLLGGYLFARPFLSAGARGWQDAERAAIAALEPLGPKPPMAFVPPAGAALSAVDRAHMLRTLRARHPLGWPEPTAQELAQLVHQFAPELVVDSRAAADRIGRLVGQKGQPRVLTADPVAYTDSHLVRWGGQVLLQISYTFWFTERPRTALLDPYGGPIDGIVWRVTLADDGQPLLWDSIHPCGCYHTLFLPADRALRLGALDATEEERPLVLPGPDAVAAVRLRYSPATHHVRQLEARSSSSGTGTDTGSFTYRFEPYERLLDPGPARPPFGPDGLLAGTERLERLFLWPSGIASPGAMRSSGRHAIAFLGRRHFETAELIDGLLRPVPSDQR